MYADDIAILAESAEELQLGLDALSQWAHQWRFMFSIGSDKSAVMVENGDCAPYAFTLGHLTLPIVAEYKYLGVVFDNRGRWLSHARYAVSKGTRKFATCVAWSAREGLHTAWRNQLFQSYVLSAFSYGSEFVLFDRGALPVMERQLRQWGRRLLAFPSGTPNPVVYGDLGWLDVRAVALKRAAGLIARLASSQHDCARDRLPAIIYAYAARQASSWVTNVLNSLASCSVPHFSASGVGPGAQLAVGQRWSLRVAGPSIRRDFENSCRQQALSIPSLAEYLARHPTHTLDSFLHNHRVSYQDAREWGLARCGHHWFCDGRPSRHAGLPVVCVLCHAAEGTLAHALVECPGYADIRQRWLSNLQVQSLPMDSQTLVQALFAGPGIHAFGQVANNIRFVGNVCRRGEAAARPSAAAAGITTRAAP